MPVEESRTAAESSRGQPLTGLDLFAGCGGLSLGFKTAGVRLLGAVESDRAAAATYSRNLTDDSESVHIGDIQDLTSGSLTNIHPELQRSSVDLVIGGPPCQAYSRIGRAKLREIRDHPEAWRLDERSTLYEHFLRIVAFLRPHAILLENVPDVLGYRSGEIPLAIARQLETLGYTTKFTLLNSAHYGVPQVRERFFLVAYQLDLGIVPVFPRPTRHLDLPRGYKDLRTGLRRPSFDRVAVQSPNTDSDLPPAVSVGQAIRDLPAVFAHLKSELPVGMRAQDRALAYAVDDVDGYPSLMRAWPGQPASQEVRSHVIRVTPRDFEIFRRMKAGDEYPAALHIAEAIYEERLHALASRNGKAQLSKAALEELRRSSVPPYNPDKFPAKWKKLSADQPAHTLTAHLGRDSYSHIHPDSNQARAISVREAARLQSFPDSFSLGTSLNAALRQIGNAVPPLLSFALATTIRAQLAGEPEPERVPDLVEEALPPPSMV